jgi:hypothetical protein
VDEHETVRIVIFTFHNTAPFHSNKLDIQTNTTTAFVSQMTRSILILILLVSVACMALAASDRNQIGSLRLLEDTFNFDKTTESTGKETGTSFGPKDWGLVRCNDVETCVSGRAETGCV